MFQKKINTLQLSHMDEMEALQERYDEAMEKASELEQVKTEMKALEKELEEKNAKLQKLSSVLKHTRHDLQVTKGNLKDLEDNFHSKLAEVEDQYKERIDLLKKENTDIRIKLIAKCEELCEEKAAMEQETTKQMQKAKAILQAALHAQYHERIEHPAEDEESVQSDSSFNVDLSTPPSEEH
ncbi:paramyosin [Latimeria chalumnae]